MSKYALAQSQFWAVKTDQVTPVLFIRLYAGAALAWTKKKRSLRNENRRGKEKVSETEDHEKQRLATLKRFKRGDDNELERNLRLEKVVARKPLRLAVETEEERRAKL